MCVPKVSFYSLSSRLSHPISAKTFKSKIYADRLAHWGYVFEDRKEDISFALTMHTAVGVDRANVKLDGVGDGVGRVEKKMDAILNLFQYV